MKIEYTDYCGDTETGLWLACGIGKRSHMVLIELDGELGWCSNDLIYVID